MIQQKIGTVWEVNYYNPYWRERGSSFFLYESDAVVFAVRIREVGGTASISKH